MRDRNSSEGTYEPMPTVSTGGRLKVDSTDETTQALLERLVELARITNIHLSALSGMDIEPEELDQD